MDEQRLDQRLRELFPRASKDFLDANTRPRICSLERELDSWSPLVDKVQREKKSDARPFVHIIMYRVRLLDKDNAYASTKCLVDCLCEVGLIPGDSIKDIDLAVRQEKVKHRHEQKTEVRIVYP